MPVDRPTCRDQRGIRFTDGRETRRALDAMEAGEPVL